jgi:hypothetical protein
MRIIKLLSCAISFMLFMQSCASNKGYFLPIVKTQTHYLPAKTQQDSLAIIPAERLDLSENTEPILTSSINSDYVSDLKLVNYEERSLELDKKVDKQNIVVKPVTKSPKLNFVQNVVLKKMESKVKVKAIEDDFNLPQFLKDIGFLLLAVGLAAVFVAFNAGILWAVLGGLFMSLILSLIIFPSKNGGFGRFSFGSC